MTALTEKVSRCASPSHHPLYSQGDLKYSLVRTGYIDALVKYGSEKQRYKGYQISSDLEYVRDHIDPILMASMGYKMPDTTKANSFGG